MRYKHIFFDLDHTLWDHNTNSKIALEEVYHQFDLQALGVPSATQFYLKFNEINHQLWDKYEAGKISQPDLRYSRFRLIFSGLDVHDHALCDELSDTYIHISSKKHNLLPNAKETLEYLFPKYPLHIITNGFDEIQSIKMNAGQITHYFQEVVTSQNSGFKKPDSRIFEYALKKVGAVAEECLMIGDSFQSDIVGANRAGIDAVFFNPDQRPQDISLKPKFEIQNLMELKKIL
ncbi:MAG: YjjG family noncanonical pyrimidine nucleotidase [Arcicella sp.]|jgi:putative hydrolase of the HAD superfamily|nr:YjjG family noncanonical pyrimidine nucleotidase [Arcicella sp.]